MTAQSSRTRAEPGYDLELEQIIADIRRSNRQSQTEFWKVGVLVAGVTAAIVQTLNLVLS